jgi:hypothetical protein
MDINLALSCTPRQCGVYSLEKLRNFGVDDAVALNQSIACGVMQVETRFVFV